MLPGRTTASESLWATVVSMAGTATFLGERLSRLSRRTAAPPRRGPGAPSQDPGRICLGFPVLLHRKTQTYVRSDPSSVAARRTAGRWVACHRLRPGTQPHSAHEARRKVKLFPDQSNRGL